ncbi:hypothetical protein ES708_18271 [subsurface metagenome]
MRIVCDLFPDLVISVTREYEKFYRAAGIIDVGMRCFPVRRNIISGAGRFETKLFTHVKCVHSRKSDPDFLATFAVTVRLPDGHGIENHHVH